MKRFSLLATVSVVCIFLILGCDQKTSSEDSSMIAKTEDFDSHFYESDRYILYLHENELTIKGTYINDYKKSIIDEIVLLEDLQLPFFQKEYSEAKVEVKGDQYFITAKDGISLEFKKFMDHIIVDSEGMEYIRRTK